MIFDDDRDRIEKRKYKISTAEIYSLPHSFFSFQKRVKKKQYQTDIRQTIQTIDFVFFHFSWSARTCICARKMVTFVAEPNAGTDAGALSHMLVQEFGMFSPAFEREVSRLNDNTIYLICDTSGSMNFSKEDGAPPVFLPEMISHVEAIARFALLTGVSKFVVFFFDDSELVLTRHEEVYNLLSPKLKSIQPRGLTPLVTFLEKTLDRIQHDNVSPEKCQILIATDGVPTRKHPFDNTKCCDDTAAFVRLLRTRRETIAINVLLILQHLHQAEREKMESAWKALDKDSSIPLLDVNFDLKSELAACKNYSNSGNSSDGDGMTIADCFLKCVLSPRVPWMDRVNEGRADGNYQTKPRPNRFNPNSPRKCCLLL